MGNKYDKNILNPKFPTREKVLNIPPRHAVILAKVSELSNGVLPLLSLQILYLQHGEKGRSEMITNFLEEIKEEITIENEPSKGEN